jgi:hypothetical protein
VSTEAESAQAEQAAPGTAARIPGQARAKPPEPEAADATEPPGHPPRPFAPPRPSEPPAPVGAPLHVASVRPTDHPAPPEPPSAIRGSLRRTVTAAACLVLGLGLLGGAVAGTWIGDDGGDTTKAAGYERARELWHSLPVNTLFPPTVYGKGAGPGDADRTWTRVAVAPDSGCRGAFDRNLARALAPVGCERLLRATYTDATGSGVTTVGVLFTKAGPQRMAALHDRFTAEHLDVRSDLMPRTYPAPRTPADGFGSRQRASWTVSVLTGAPVVVFAVSGFADGRVTTDPRPAADAVRPGATSAPAQAGLGHDAQGLADRVERSLRPHLDPHGAG